MATFPRARVLFAAVTTAGLLAGCGSEPDASGPLPEPTRLLGKAAETSQRLQSAQFSVSVNGQLPGITVQSADGALTRTPTGQVDAKGSAQVQRSDQLVKLDYVLTGDTVYLRNPAGDLTEAPATTVTSVYDPAILLDERRGVSNLLRRVDQARTEGRETIEGQETIRVGGKLSKEHAEATIPGIEDTAPADDQTDDQAVEEDQESQETIEVKFWLADSAAKEPVRAWFQLPPATKGSGARMIELSLAKFNEPVTVNAPA
ncbi:lipoprotein LprG [Tamaricihabitans halophyticus]|uniref:Lipoprotein LprG n=1 Tax=Tamaricihabitans halophyticus TaxID=1262583 RepID=A0A4R2QNN8_9PSEU|nr:LppX_LprAFG lipoprotein [Tamaricihabitans halophyticus]TCP48661.1 lipoprotein LprG [Tamaricihabitans halophyticus]